MPPAKSRTSVGRARSASVEDAQEFVTDQDTPSQVVEANETFGRLRDLFPEDRREILALKVEGLSSREIGQRLGISERTVRRILEDLRRRAAASDKAED